ncbi:HAD family hydrolase [Novosphingobium piscinae]|uniref:HAD-IA family hydrolase n=1 Tax=Novosphingobium piscinae TaxID=1507448 RepID=A0A7X1FY29_9SPHN|nr:HAD-IA family hydrolase [Novosphingobium piscinae]MBC2669100.1 HAD-IA family hydrolase [Novosphingobium piscinae]
MSQTGGIEAVVFDIGRVLVHWDMRALFRQLIADPAELDWFCSTVVTEQWHYQHDAGRPLAEMVAERKAQFPACAALIDAYATRFNETIPGPIEGTVALVEALHARGVPLFAITNFGADLWQGFRPTLPVLARFRDIVVSGVERVAKPDPAIYALAERRFGHSGPALLFIDDNAANIAAAQAAGWHGHLFTAPALLAQDLAGRGLL